MVYFMFDCLTSILLGWRCDRCCDWNVNRTMDGAYFHRIYLCDSISVIMRNYYLKDLKELSNQELLEMRDTAYEEELRLKKNAWRYGSKTSLSRRVTSCANEMGRRMIEGTMEFNDEGELI